MEGTGMPKYLMKVKFTPDGLKGLKAAGAASRPELGRKIAAALGGTMECYYFAFGEWDVYSIMDLPNDQAAAALSTQGGVTGSVQGEVTKLLTAEELDEAFGLDTVYRAPGQ
jgi:uncharacterized protein with GYD domain